MKRLYGKGRKKHFYALKHLNPVQEKNQYLYSGCRGKMEQLKFTLLMRLHPEGFFVLFFFNF